MAHLEVLQLASLIHEGFDDDDYDATYYADLTVRAASYFMDHLKLKVLSFGSCQTRSNYIDPAYAVKREKQLFVPKAGKLPGTDSEDSSVKVDLRALRQNPVCDIGILEYKSPWWARD